MLTLQHVHSLVHPHLHGCALRDRTGLIRTQVPHLDAGQDFKQTFVHSLW